MPGGKNCLERSKWLRIIIPLSVILMLFQNCSGGFEANHILQSADLSSGSNNQDPVPNPEPTPTPDPTPAPAPAPTPTPVTDALCPAYSTSKIYRTRTNRVVVGPNDNWQNAINNAQSNTEILLKDGTYNLTEYALYLKSGVTVRGQSGSRDAVIIKGKGYSVGSEGLTIKGSDVTIADLTIHTIGYHAIAIKGDQATHRAQIYNVHLYNTGQQQIKLTPGGAQDGLIACSKIGYTVGGVKGDYVNGIDLHQAIKWTIRDNDIYNLTGDGSGCYADGSECPGYLSGPAILVWNNSADTVVERNTIVNSYRGIALGLGNNHSGGIIRNNFIYAPALKHNGDGSRGVELAGSTGARVYNNTIRVNASGGAIDVWVSSNTRVFNNLLSSAPNRRDSSSWQVSGNLNDARDTDFLSAADVHLAANSRAIGAGVAVEDVLSDIDGESRAGRIDIGADQALGSLPTPTPTPEPNPTPSPTPVPGDVGNAPLLQKSNMSYLGAFALPELNSDIRFGYGGNGVTPYRDPNTGKMTLFMEGHAWYPGNVAQVDVPSNFVNSKTWSLLPKANLLQNFARITDGKGSTLGGNSGGSNFIYGMLPFNGRLIVASSNSYDADASQHTSHGASSFNLASQTDFTGYFPINSVANPRSLGGYMTTIPSEWQSLFGGPALTGNCCLSIISATSSGPALTVFNPDDVGVKHPIPGKTLLFYPLDHYFTLDNYNAQAGGNTKGVAFPSGSRSVLFIGRSSAKEYCYGPGTTDKSLHGVKTEGGTWCYDPCDSSKGGHGYPYYHQVLAYDANELLQVKSGQKQPWEVMPYATWQLDDMSTNGCAGIKGAGFEPNSGRLFITQEFGEDARVDVYQINVPGK